MIARASELFARSGRRIRGREIGLGLLIGGVGFAVNRVELELGWGLDFMFGNALVFAFLRVLPPPVLVLAASLASVQTIVEWNHPWAWAIWTLEAWALSFWSRRASPISINVIFWLLAGAPLLALTYGAVMGMDGLSLGLVITKQAVNGVLNVTIAELLYLLALLTLFRNAPAPLPRMPINALLPTLLMGTTLIPTTIYLRIDAPIRSRASEQVVEGALKESSTVADTALQLWQQSRAFLLAGYVERLLHGTVPPGPALPDGLRKDFRQVDVFDLDGGLVGAAPGGSVVPRISSDRLRRLHALGRPSLVDAEGGGAWGRSLWLAVPVNDEGHERVIVGGLVDGALKQALEPLVDQDVAGVFLYNDAGSLVSGVAANSSVADGHGSLPPELRAAKGRHTVIVGKEQFGKSAMSALRDAVLEHVAPLAAVEGWQVVSIGKLDREILEARRGHLQLFLALCLFLVCINLLALLIARRARKALRTLAQSAADLALMGAGKGRIDSLVVQELSDISVSIATAGSEVARERGGLVNYQRRLRSITHHAPIVVYALDIGDGSVEALVYISQTLERFLGYTADEATEPGWWTGLLHPDDRERCMELYGDLPPGAVIRHEYRLRHRLGHYVWVYDNMAVEADPVTGKVEAVGVLIDISDRKLATAQLVQADKMASLGRMLAGITHELNQPLNFIKVAAVNLKERVAVGRIEPAHFTQKLDSILAHVNRAAAIILHMRVFGRMPSESARPMRIRQALDAVVTMIGPQLEVDEIVLDVSRFDRAVMVRALPVLLEQVLLNLLLNAQDAIHARKAAGDKSPGHIVISVTRQDRNAIIVVEDNGIGLSDETLEMIFEPFFTTKPPRKGTGLGLSISYGIIRELSGAIRAENGLHGARFIIELPLAEQPEALVEGR